MKTPDIRREVEKIAAETGVSHTQALLFSILCRMDQIECLLARAENAKKAHLLDFSEVEDF